MQFVLILWKMNKLNNSWIFSWINYFNGFGFYGTRSRKQE